MIIRSFLHIIAAALFTALAALPAASQSADKTDRLGVPGPVSFEGQNYVLAAAAHPQPNYFKQEYLPAGQGPDSYTHMFLIETMTEGAAPNDAAASQIAMLNERKAKGDPLVNHEVKFNDATGEIFLDFLISGSSNGQVVVEWDAYRYVPIKGEKPGVILYGISRRAYGETEGRAFLSGLKEQRPNTLKTLTSFDVPEITPKP